MLLSLGISYFWVGSGLRASGLEFRVLEFIGLRRSFKLFYAGCEMERRIRGARL